MTDAKKRANEKYLKEKCDTIIFRVPKGKKEKIKDYAESKGESLSGYINRLIKQDMKDTD